MIYTHTYLFVFFLLKKEKISLSPLLIIPVSRVISRHFFLFLFFIFFPKLFNLISFIYLFYIFFPLYIPHSSSNFTLTIPFLFISSSCPKQSSIYTNLYLHISPSISTSLSRTISIYTYKHTYIPTRRRYSPASIKFVRSKRQSIFLTQNSCVLVT